VSARRDDERDERDVAREVAILKWSALVNRHSHGHCPPTAASHLLSSSPKRGPGPTWSTPGHLRPPGRLAKARLSPRRSLS
jgi:hypothetical protein